MDIGGKCIVKEKSKIPERRSLVAAVRLGLGSLEQIGSEVGYCLSQLAEAAVLAKPPYLIDNFKRTFCQNVRCGAA